MTVCETVDEAERVLDELFVSLDSGRISAAELIRRLPESAFRLLTTPSLRLPRQRVPLATGAAVARGVAAGRLYPDLAALLAGSSPEPKLLFCERIGNLELCHLDSIAAIVSSKEDASSHAVIVSRVRNTPVVTGLDAAVTTDGSAVRIGERLVLSGEHVCVDGFAGRVFLGDGEIVRPTFAGALPRLMDLLVTHSRLSVYANADTGVEAKLAADSWAAGYEPRTEHMILQAEKLRPLQRALLAEPADRQRHLPAIVGHFREEILAMYRVAGEHPVHLRLLDPPIHEFLPAGATERAGLAGEIGIPLEELNRRINEVAEVNPMMGLRGARLLIMRPEIVRAQVEATFHAALDHLEETGHEIVAHLTLPMIVDAREIIRLRAQIDRVCAAVAESRGHTPVFRVGIMIETPRAALLAGTMAEHVDYISFGTNDLTAQTFALSRGDVFGKFLTDYLADGILDADPFAVLDESVRMLMAGCVSAMRERNPALRASMCGEQAGHPDVIAFCLEHGVNAVAVAPASVPQALFHAASLSVRGS